LIFNRLKLDKIFIILSIVHSILHIKIKILISINKPTIMKKTKLSIVTVLAFLTLLSCDHGNKSDEASFTNSNLFEFQNVEARWSSFENITAEKGKGGMENKGAKGHPCDVVKAGESVILLDVTGPGMINRIWVTINDRSPEMLRSLKIEMFWDNNDKPAVSAPFGDFFGVGLGRRTPFENALFADPEGRSFNCFIQMPFKEAARVVLTNESEKDLDMLFFDINLIQFGKWDTDYMYFHCYWHRDTATILGEDFQILPKVSGKGRFLGTNIGINANPVYGNHWWGEGEVKMYVDGDTDWPTLAGTGTEDYIGTAWGQGIFCTRYTGCLVADGEKKQWAFFRYHIPDPIFFKTDIKVTIQQMGGNQKESVLAYQQKGIPLIPVTIHQAPVMHHIYDPDNPTDLSDENLPDAWVNYYRSDDVSAAAYFYLDKPENELPPIQGLSIRTCNL